MRSYTHLSPKERQRIEYLYATGHSQRAIARSLRRCLKTIQNELKRVPNYSWDAAYEHYRQMRLNRKTKIGRNKNLQEYIASSLNKKWSPEQIAGRLGYQNNPFSVCCKTIYNYVNRDKMLIKKLPRYKSRRIFKNLKKMREHRNPLPSVRLRNEEGVMKSWEGDLVRFGKSVQNVTTLFNRPSKLVRLIKNNNGTPGVVLNGIKKYANDIKILTMDRGVEFLRVDWFYDHGIDPYYCDPMNSGQKGGCENTNGRLRKYLPRGTDIGLVDQNALDIIESEMNNTPRKCLGFMTPNEAYKQMLK